MIVARHEDGRIVLMASEHGLPPAMRTVNGDWVTDPSITGEELSDFITVYGPERMQLVEECRKALNRNVTTVEAWSSLFQRFAVTSWLDWDHVRLSWKRLLDQFVNPAELGCDEALICLGLAKRDYSGETVYRTKDGLAWMPPASGKPESTGALQAPERPNTARPVTVVWLELGKDGLRIVN